MTDHTAPPDLLTGLTDAAGRLGQRFSDAAEAATDDKALIEFTNLFTECFKAYRLGRLLQLRGLKPLPAFPATADRDRPERDVDRDPRDDDRDREADYEPVSLPKFLNSLGLVARKATDHPTVVGDVRDDLALIRSAAVQAKQPDVKAALAVLNRPKPKPDRLSSLLGSSAPLRPPKPNSS